MVSRETKTAEWFVDQKTSSSSSRKVLRTTTWNELIGNRGFPWLTTGIVFLLGAYAWICSVCYITSYYVLHVAAYYYNYYTCWDIIEYNDISLGLNCRLVPRTSKNTGAVVREFTGIYLSRSCSLGTPLSKILLFNINSEQHLSNMIKPTVYSLFFLNEKYRSKKSGLQHCPHPHRNQKPINPKANQTI